ncbi:VWA domain-containing protein [Methylomonas sp. LL1]|uniref:vWA domain-containing protein n=1 Tax=Methylomonas sp. LL1 TaxID=2785785 RepID=UPI0018C3AB7B|nr:vWA domain-containing protein [Methylomonas sp. LL1]QPK65439.1 VWA domain-containing protein [Methylomonas sp. LL1]
MNFSTLLKDYRFWCLSLSLLALLVMVLYPTQIQKQPVYKLIFVVDITRSMNAEDYRVGDKAISRLEFVKHSLRDLIGRLPCQSQVGLGVFTERRSTILFEPVEVCSGYAELDKSIDSLDWRMAWAADSRIAGGLLNAMSLLKDKETTLVFISDGQEAPPLNSRYRTDFAEVKGKLKGLIVGTGGLQPVAIPKFDAKGQRIGVYEPDDVPHRSSFGESDLNPEKIEGYDARNAPFGKQAATGSEHLSALQEGYLQQLAAESGLAYHRLQTSEALEGALLNTEFALITDLDADIRGYYASAVLLLLMLIWVGK